MGRASRPFGPVRLRPLNCVMRTPPTDCVTDSVVRDGFGYA
ncbi:hypothetical protein HMPREF0972_01074 [Actinomyces sp. oral taxon 848 str. F0332]|nr:hypothetical protein HMPREF0972_01074 [Actinomyces sp. oral taxon 848 str. F0332]